MSDRNKAIKSLQVFRERLIERITDVVNARAGGVWCIT